VAATPKGPKAKKMVCFKYRDTGECDKVDCQYLHMSAEEAKKLSTMMTSAATSGKSTPKGRDKAGAKAKAKAKGKKKKNAEVAAAAAAKHDE
jgi:hypothetical protein